MASEVSSQFSFNPQGQEAPTGTTLLFGGTEGGTQDEPEDDAGDQSLNGNEVRVGEGNGNEGNGFAAFSPAEAAEAPEDD